MSSIVSLVISAVLFVTICIIGHKRCAFCDDIEALARREDSHMLYDPKLHVLGFLKKLERLRQSI